MDITNNSIISTISAFVSVDKDGNEYVIGKIMPIPMSPFDGWMPFLFADPTNVHRMLPDAIEIARMTKVPFRIIQFESRVDLTEKYTNEYNEAIRNAKLN